MDGCKKPVRTVEQGPGEGEALLLTAEENRRPIFRRREWISCVNERAWSTSRQASSL